MELHSPSVPAPMLSGALHRFTFQCPKKTSKEKERGLLSRLNENKPLKSPSPLKMDLQSPSVPAPLLSGALHRFTFQCPKKTSKEKERGPLSRLNENKPQKSPSLLKMELHSPSVPAPMLSGALHRFTFQCPKKTSKARKRYPTPPVKPLGSPLSSQIVSNNHKLTEYFPVRRSVRKTKKTVLEEKQRCIVEAVLAKQEVGLEVTMFDNKGRGVIAVQPFHRDQFVIEYAGELITGSEAREREQMYAQDKNIGCYMYYFNHQNVRYCVDATAESDRLGRLVNHSRKGNLTTKTVVIDNSPHLVLIAKDDIQPGEEVTFDYGDRSKESLRYHPWLAS